jgi:hypothetical protein
VTLLFPFTILIFDRLSPNLTKSLVRFIQSLRTLVGSWRVVLIDWYKTRLSISFSVSFSSSLPFCLYRASTSGVIACRW